MESISYKTKFAILGAILVPCFGRLALHGTGSEYDLYRYFVPLFVGSLAGYLIGLMRDNWIVTNKDLRAVNEVLKKEVNERKRTEEALQESEKRQKQIIENSNAGYFFIDREGHFQHVNSAWLRLHNYETTEEIIGKHFSLTQVQGDLPNAHTNVEQLLSGKEIISGEFSRRCKDGAIGYHNFTARPVMKKEVIVGLEGFLIDITERKQAEAILRESEIKHKTLIKNIPGMVYRAYPDWSAKIVSGCEKISSYTTGELNSKEKNWLSIIHPDDTERVFKEGSVLATRPKDLTQTYRIITKYGNIRWVEDHKTSLVSKEGEFIGIDGVVFDITERKHAEEALRESEEKYRSMMESMKDEAYICLSDFRIQYMNPATVSRIGRDATGELCYKTIYGLDEQCSWCVFDKVLQGEYVEYELLNPNNNRYYSISNSPIRHTDSSISKLSICRDITDVKKMELQLQQDHKMKIIGTLAGGIAHQFNNDLYVITGNIDLLEMDFPSDENVANYAKEMKASARQMTHLAAQLLAYARGGKYQAKTVSLSNFVKETLSLVKHTIDSAIDVDTDLPRDILNVKVDLTQMQMVMSAVMTNASEAMEGKGRIQVACRNTIITDETVGGFPGLTPGNYVNLTIADDGKGMDEETRNRIFEPFFTTKFEGRGLGMAAAYGIVKNHDGWISVDSELGQGTTVKIYLPAIESVQTRPAGLPVAETPVKEDPKPKTELIKGTGTILVIEDEEPVMKVSRIILEKMGYSVLEARTGQEAVDVVKTFDGHIDLAMLDILLPDMSGNDICPLIMEARPDLKVIVFSGYSIDGPAREILNAGAEDFIQKPFAMADLSEKLKKILGDGQ